MNPPVVVICPLQVVLALFPPVVNRPDPRLMFPAPAKAPIVSAPPKSTVLPLAIVTVAASESMLAAVVTSFPAFTFTADPPVQPPPFKVNVPAPFLFTL